MFGAQLPNGKHAFPTGPTWILYSGNDQQCTELVRLWLLRKMHCTAVSGNGTRKRNEKHCLLQVPVLLRRGTFCNAYVAQARVFRTYSSWVLGMLLSKVRSTC